MNHLESAFTGKNEWWKYLIIIVASLVVANTIGSIPLAIVAIIQTVNNGVDPTAIQGLNFSAMGINSTLGLSLIIFPFIISLITIIFLVKPLHKRSFSTVINGTNTIRWRRIIIGYSVWLVIMAFILVVDYYINIDNYEVQLNWGKLIPLAIVSLLLIPFQAGYEEIVLRGYLAQGVGRLTRSRIAVIIIPSIFFALMHGMNPEIQKFGFWAMMPQYFIVGVVYAIVSVFDDGIELAIGAHAANNTFLSIFVVTEGTVFQTDAMLRMFEVDMPKEYVSLIIGSIVFVGALAFKYRWSFKQLLSPIKANVEE